MLTTTPLLAFSLAACSGRLIQCAMLTTTPLLAFSFAARSERLEFAEVLQTTRFIFRENK